MPNSGAIDGSRAAEKSADASDAENTTSVKVWDLSIRIFHWSIVALLPALYFTAKQGGEAMEYHAIMGYIVLWLMIFRLIWGFFGSRYARFSSFLYSPRTFMSYAISLVQKRHSSYVGHNPIGGISVLLMIILLVTQVATGLFANDDILLEGPLAVMTSGEISSTLTWIHKLTFNVLLYFLALHVGAILFYRVYLQSNLVSPMITGKKTLSRALPPSVDHVESWFAASMWAIAAVAAFFIINLPDLAKNLGFSY